MYNVSMTPEKRPFIEPFSFITGFLMALLTVAIVVHRIAPLL